ncbi:MAG TPA: NAD-dependent epimerase/dehydratase family protein [Opitutus sp.]|nr:NAD-dependent epimerase/dehydratase family protein [Opitutus sp.]
MKVAILGASGFIGGRLFERWQRGGLHAPRAVVRSPAGLARVARFAAPDWRLADARDEAALAAACAGCEAVVHCVVGDERVIAATIEPAYRAAARAGAKDLVYLSTASVHGLNPPAGTNEDSPLRDDQSFGYNNAKVRAERRLRALGADGRVRVTILRPGIVIGPRSRWVTDVARALAESRAWWLDGGAGICNSVQVDNLVHAIELVLAKPDAAGETYLVGDAETVTWRDLYLGLAAAFGRDASAFAEARPAALRRRDWRDRVAAIKGSGPAQAMLPWFSPRLKGAVNAALARWHAPPDPDPWRLPRETTPVASAELTQLFACTTKLPHGKAAAALGYEPPVSLTEGLRRVTAWLEIAGYPVAGRAAKA